MVGASEIRRADGTNERLRVRILWSLDLSVDAARGRVCRYALWERGMIRFGVGTVIIRFMQGEHSVIGPV